MTTDTDTPTAVTLRLLLDDELQYSPSYRRTFSSHLAMALVALEQLGAPDELLADTLAEHARHDPEFRDDWADLRLRLAEVERDGIDATVRRRLPALVDAPATALYHPMIRLAYALDVSHPGQVAAALLDWERRRDVLPVPSLTTGPRRLADVARDLAAHGPSAWPHTFDLHGIARRPELNDALRGVAVDAASLDDVSAFALAAHVTADDFLTLHLVTGSRAAQAVSGWLDPGDVRRLAAAMVTSMAVGYAAVGAPPLLAESDLAAIRRAELPSAPAIAARAITHSDPHVIKLANVALVEEQRTGDPLYRFVAARVVGLLAPAGARAR